MEKKIKHFSADEKKFDLFFKLLFLLPNVKIKLLHKLILIIKKLSYNCRRNIIIKIYKKFHRFYKRYLIKFLKIHRKKKFKPSVTTYKLEGTFLFLEIHKKKKGALTYLKFNNSRKKERYHYYDLVFFNHDVSDFNLYKSFFLKNSRIKWELNKLKKRKDELTNSYEFAYKSIFIWPFIIIIKPFTIIIKNIFFKPFFIFKKWFKRTYNQKRYSRNKLYSQIYKIIIVKAKQANINNIKHVASKYYWYIMQKYYFSINTDINYSNKFWYLGYSKYYNVFYRGYSKHYNSYSKKMFKENKKQKKRFFHFNNSYFKFLKRSFIGLSFFFRLYSLYFFWFIYFINNLLYYVNKLLFSYWFRFFYYSVNINKGIQSQLLISYKILYKNFKDSPKYLNFEDSINNLLSNIINIIYWNYGYLIKFKEKNNFYKNYFSLLFFFYFKNYFFINVFINYNIMFKNNLKKDYSFNNNFLDWIYVDNYKYNNIYKLEYYSIKQRIYRKYNPYYKLNNKKFMKLNEEGKEKYNNSLNKRGLTLFLN